jgi:hypothetical protein
VASIPAATPPTVKRILCLAACLVLASTAAFARSEPRQKRLEGEPVQSVIWVGNSFFYFNNGIHRYLGGIAGGVDRAARIRSVLVGVGGSGIDWHDVDSYLRPGSRMGSYSFVNDNNIRFNKPGRQFDVMVIMDCSQCPIHPELKGVFREYAKLHSETARKYGVRPVFFMSWAYKDVPSMTEALAEAYTTVANDNDALVVPAGLAFARAARERPDLELYQPDKRHPSLIGTFLAAATTYASLTGKSPEANTTYNGGIEPALAAWLQAVAWKTVQEYYGAEKAKPAPGYGG